MEPEGDDDDSNSDLSCPGRRRGRHRRPGRCLRGLGGFTDKSDELNTDSFAFTGTLPEQVNSNENYYDGDFADFDGDGICDRSLGARYGLLMNTGEGLFVPYAGYTGYLLRGMSGASGWGEDGFQWADVDNDGDYDNFSGGNGEPLTLQVNRGGGSRRRGSSAARRSTSSTRTSRATGTWTWRWRTRFARGAAAVAR